MKNALRKLETFDRRSANDPLGPDLQADRLRKAIDASWVPIAPFWPLRGLVAVNPLQGLEDLPFEEALVEAAAWFQQRELPEPLDAVNRETIKWCQAFFDDGQATIAMPLRQRGLYDAWRLLAPFDRRLHGGDADKRAWLAALPAAPERAIGAALEWLDVPSAHHTRFMMLLLTTLPGWAAHVRYRTDWADSASRNPHPVSGIEYLALRLAITAVLWPGAKALLSWHLAARETARNPSGPLPDIARIESEYSDSLLRALSKRARSHAPQSKRPRAQVVFCIDVRAEPFRRALEEVGDYETLGCAGFFGVPIEIADADSGKASRACPVLLEPRCTVRQSSVDGAGGSGRLNLLRRLYQSLKYTFTAPFALVETLGLANGVWMALLSFAPVQADRLRHWMAGWIQPPMATSPDIGDIPPGDRCAWAESVLRSMGLTHDFARLVVLCGHGSTTRNNPYAAALDCGACGGRHGGTNAQVLAAILNDPWVREHLIGRGIRIPGTTHFIAAQHDTTTDEVTILGPTPGSPELVSKLQALEQDLARTRLINTRRRVAALGGRVGAATARGAETEAHAWHVLRRSRDWAEVQPEWGLARNAAFIAAPRALTRGLDLDGRVFLHSYDWRQDPDGAALTLILTAPMVVAQWINAQYLFSTLDNVSFGSGSKVTQNVCGKLGVMQGNASDLMHGLPLQSVFASDSEAWHKPMRLLTVVHAPRDFVQQVVRTQPELEKLFGNGWVTLACIDAEEGGAWILQRDLGSWRRQTADQR
jgi:uncharacterized protein YbcC (UPF0753/DUF2309 family)